MVLQILINSLSQFTPTAMESSPRELATEWDVLPVGHLGDLQVRIPSSLCVGFLMKSAI